MENLMRRFRRKRQSFSKPESKSKTDGDEVKNVRVLKLQRTRHHSLQDIPDAVSHMKINEGFRKSSNDLNRNFTESQSVCGTEHLGKPSYICLKENKIFCNICVRIHNFQCRDIAEYIPEMSDELYDELCTDARNKLISMKNRFEKVKDENQINLKELQNERRVYLHSVMQFNKKVKEILDRLETDAIDAVTELYVKGTKRHDDNHIRLENVISELENYLQQVKVKGDNQDNINTMFTVQEATKAEMKYQPVLYDIHKRSYALDFAFTPSPEFCKLIDNAGELWAMSKKEIQSCLAPVPCSCDRPFRYRRAEHDKKVSVKCFGFRFSDRGRCNITGCEFLENGNLLLADNNNRKVKLMDTKYKMVSVLTLPWYPWDVCAIGTDMAVVSLPDKSKLQFIETSPKLSLKHSISAGKNCWGVTKNGDNLIVTCWSIDTSHILIMDFLGNIKERIPTFSMAWYVTSFDEVIYVSDWGTSSVTCLTMDGKTVGNCKDGSLTGPFGINTDPEGNVYICGRDSNYLLQSSTDGKLRTLVSQADGMYKPTCASHCPKDDRLVVASWMADTLHVYRLK